MGNIIAFVTVGIIFLLFGIGMIILYMGYKKAKNEEKKWEEIELKLMQVEADLFQFQLKKRREYIYKKLELLDKYYKENKE